MTFISWKSRTVAVAAVALLTTPLWGQALFQDGFESKPSANDDLRVRFYAGTSTDDDTLGGSHDYSARTDNRLASETPKSVVGASKGLKIRVNKNDDDPGGISRSLHPLTKSAAFIRTTCN